MIIEQMEMETDSNYSGSGNLGGVQEDSGRSYNHSESGIAMAIMSMLSGTATSALNSIGKGYLRVDEHEQEQLQFQLGQQHSANDAMLQVNSDSQAVQIQNTGQNAPMDPNEYNNIVNVTRDYPIDYAMVMLGYMMPIVLIITIITNTLVVMVLYQRHMRTPTNIVLFTMAIVDLCTLLSPSPWYLYIYTFGNHNTFLYPPTACYAHHIMTDVIPIFFHTSSIWLALLLAGQRYIYVCHPTLARTW